MTFLWLWLFNLKSTLFWFMVVGMILSFAIGGWSLLTRGRHDFASPEYTNSHNRIWTALQSGVILAITYALIAAVPSPTYDVRYVDRKVEIPVTKVVKVPVYKDRTVTIVPRFDYFYSRCAISYGVDLNDDVRDSLSFEAADKCKQFAVEAIDRTFKGPRPQVKVIKEQPEFSKFFQECARAFTGNDAKIGLSIEGKQECQSYAESAMRY